MQKKKIFCIGNCASYNRILYNCNYGEKESRRKRETRRERKRMIHRFKNKATYDIGEQMGNPEEKEKKKIKKNEKR